MRTRNRIIVAVFASWMIGYSVVINPSDMEKDSQEYQKAYSLILNKQWNEAEKIFKKIIDDYPDGPWVDDSDFWLCYILEKKATEPDEAFDCYQSFIENYRNSKWVDDAKSNMIHLAKELEEQGKMEYIAMVESMEKNEKEEIIMAAIQALQGRGDEKSFNTLIRLYDQSDVLSVKKKIIYVLGTFGTNQSGEKLLSIIKNEKKPELRKEAIFWIAQDSPTDEVIEELTSLIHNDEDYSVRKKAIFALAQSGHESAQKSLINIAKNNDNDDIRAEAVFWLSQSDGSDETLAVLTDLVLNDKDRKVRKKAIFALSQFEDSKGFPAIIKIAREAEDDGLRAEAVFWLSQSSKTEEALEVLKDLAMNDANIEVQKKAVFSISQLPSNISFPVMKNIAEGHQKVEMRQQAVFWVGQLDGKAEVLEFLKKVVYNDPDPSIKDKAVFAIGQLSDNKGTPVLIDIAMNHPNLSVRKKAIFWLGQSEDKEAKEALEKVLFNE